MNHVLDIIKNYFSRQKGIAAVFIFGSHARGRQTPESDLDIAVLFASNSLPDLKTQLSFKADLEKITLRDIDVVSLNTADPIIKYQVFKFGKIVDLKDRAFYLQFLVKSLNEYNDLKITRRMIEETLHKRKIYGQ